MSNGEKSSAAQTVTRVERDRTSAMLDEALGETFPASDPVAITPAKRAPAARGLMRDGVVVSSDDDQGNASATAAARDAVECRGLKEAER